MNNALIDQLEIFNLTQNVEVETMHIEHTQVDNIDSFDWEDDEDMNGVDACFDFDAAMGMECSNDWEER